MGKQHQVGGGEGGGAECAGRWGEGEASRQACLCRLCQDADSRIKIGY